MNRNERVKLGFIGFSRYARRAYWPWLRENNLAEVKGISCDLDLCYENAKEYEGVPYVFDYKAMIQDYALDAVIVTTPHALHFDQAKFCLNHCLHVLVDKPLACNISQANELVQLASRKGKYLAVGVERRYETVYKLAKQIVKEGKIGEIRCIDCSLARAVDPGFRESWRNDPFLSGGGVLIDSGYHTIDVTLWITGLKTMKSRGFITKDDLEVEKSCVVSTILSNGAIGNLTFTYVSPHSLKYERIRLYGTEGVLEIVNHRPDGGKRTPTLTLQTKKSKTAVSMLDNERLISCPEAPLRNLIEAIVYQFPLISEASSTLSTLQLITDIYEKQA